MKSSCLKDYANQPLEESFETWGKVGKCIYNCMDQEHFNYHPYDLLWRPRPLRMRDLDFIMAALTVGEHDR